MKTFFWIVAYIMIAIPIILSLISIFLMLTYRVDETYYIDDGSWGQDIDQMAKNRYNSDT